MEELVVLAATGLAAHPDGAAVDAAVAAPLPALVLTVNKC